jgi:nicotinamidase/pyrazinamidase
MTQSVPTFERGDAILVVDPQRDFCPGGSLGVPGGHAVIPHINEFTAEGARAGIHIFVSRDWHPPRTTHFAEHGGTWPAHCIMGTEGAQFHPDLRLPAGTIIVSKGMGEDEDAYSAFQARDEAGAPLGRLLAERDVRRLYLMGLATDYCVRATALDARRQGLAVRVVARAIRAVNLQPHHEAEALAEMQAAGAELI